MKKFYRNKESVSTDNVIVDEGHLWELKEGKMVLVDDDEYIEVLPSANFELEK